MLTGRLEGVSETHLLAEAYWKLTLEHSTLGRKGVHYCRFYFLLLAPQNIQKKIWAHQHYAAACYKKQAALASTKARDWEPALGPGHIYILVLFFQPRSSAPSTELWSHQEPL